MSRPIRRYAVCALAVAALAGCGSPVKAGAAALVGDTRISTEQLAAAVDEGLADPAAAQLAADRGSFQRQLLTRIIGLDVVDAAARDAGVQVTASDVDAQYAALQSSVGGADQLKQQAATAGLTLARVRDLARTRALTVALGDELTKDVPVTQAQLEQAYTAGIDGFDQVRTAQVQLADLAAAQALLPQAAGLSDSAFAALATSSSLDETTKASGGDLGYLPRSTFATNGLDAYGAAAFAAKVGDTFAVASPKGGHVVRVLGRRTTTLAQATTQLRRTILQQQQGAAVQALLDRTAARLHISVNPRFGTWHPADLSVAAPADAGRHEVSSPAAPAGGPAPQPSDGGILPSPAS